MREAREDQIQSVGSIKLITSPLTFMHVLQIQCNKDGIPIPILEGQQTEDKRAFHFDPSTKIHLSDDPLLPDPMETKFVEVRQSDIPNAGEGLFLVKDVKAQDIVAFFNGVRVSVEDVTKIKVHRKSSHRLWNDWRDEDMMLDVTPEYRYLKRLKLTDIIMSDTEALTTTGQVQATRSILAKNQMFSTTSSSIQGLVRSALSEPSDL